MNKKQTKPILLPIAPKDIFRILAPRSVVEQPAMIQKLLDNFESIRQGIPRSSRLIRDDPFQYSHTGLSGKAEKRANDKNKNFKRLCFRTVLKLLENPRKTPLFT